MKNKILKHKELILILLLFLFGLSSRIYYSSHCLWMDEARELIISRSLVRDGNFYYLGTEWRQHPYGFYLLIASSMLLNGFTDFAGMIVVNMLGAFAIVLVYLIGRDLYEPKVGYIASIIFATHSLVWFLSERILNDIPVLTFMLLSLWTFIKLKQTTSLRDAKIYAIVCGFAIGYSMLIKLTGGLLILIYATFILLEVIRERKEFSLQCRYYLLILLVITLTFGSWLVFNYFTIGEIFPFDIYAKRLGSGMTTGVDVQPWYYYIVVFYDTMQLPLLLGFVFGFFSLVLMKFRKSSILLIWIVEIFLFMSFMWAVKVPRYILPIVPVMCVIAGVGINKLFVDIFPNKEKMDYVLILLLVALIANLQWQDAVSMIELKKTDFCGFDAIGYYLKAQTFDGYVMTSSIAQIGWYADTNNILMTPHNITEFIYHIYDMDVSYHIVDFWERTEPNFVYYMNDSDPWIENEIDFYLVDGDILYAKLFKWV